VTRENVVDYLGAIEIMLDDQLVKALAIEENEISSS
jgi:hypothetical protein